MWFGILGWLISREEFQLFCSSPASDARALGFILFYSCEGLEGGCRGERSVIWSFLMPDNAVRSLLFMALAQVPCESVCPHAHSSNGQVLGALITISGAELTILNPEG